MRKLVAYLYGILLISSLVSCTSIVEHQESAPASQPGPPPPGDHVRVSHVIDGDTIEVDGQRQKYRVRYIGVDTPERDEPFYQEATEANRRMVEQQEVILVRDVSETDQYGRLLRYVYLQDGTFVNAELIGQGYGRVVTFPPDVAQIDLFTRLQRRAREDLNGLWSQSEMQALPLGCDTCGKNSYNCRDFDTQAAAQACFDTCLIKTGQDIHRLDGGGDGIVCESLP